MHDPPQARIQKEFISQGVMRVDPQSYLQRFGAELDSGQAQTQYHHLVDEAIRTVAPPPRPPPMHDQPASHVAHVWDKIRSIPYSPAYHQENAQYHPSYPPHADQPPWMGNANGMMDLPHSSLPSHSPYAPQTIQVNSDSELQHVLSDLTQGRVPSPLRSS